MKQHSIKLFAIGLIAIFALTINSFAAEVQKTFEVKMKTSVTTASGKEKIEIMTNMLKGVKECEMKMEDKTFEVKYDPDQISPEMLLYAVQNLGFTADVIENKELKEDETKVSENK